MRVTPPIAKEIDMDWSETAFAIVLAFCLFALIILVTVLHYVKKIVNWFISPITSRTNRK